MESEGFYICDCCGDLLPGDMMIWCDNGELFCEECWAEMNKGDDD